MITNEQDLQKAISEYEDMMAELQPLLWQRDALLKEIEEAIVAQKATVITDGFIYSCQTGKMTDNEAAVKAAGVPQEAIDEATTVTIKITKLGVDLEWLEATKTIADVTESTAWSKIKIPSTVKEKFTVEKPGKMKVEIK